MNTAAQAGQSRRRRPPSPLVVGLLALAVSTGLWAAGFGWFVHVALRQSPPPPVADGIVALTGGAGRIEAALQLLAQGRARLMLVSGVGRSTEFADIAHRAGVDMALAAKVKLGRTAASTRGNAAETAAWVHDNDLHSLIVVTAGYHMPRALAELSRTLPSVALHPYPVLSPAVRDHLDLATLRLLAGEYMKFLAVEAGLSSLAARGDERDEGHDR